MKNIFWGLLMTALIALPTAMCAMDSAAQQSTSVMGTKAVRADDALSVGADSELSAIFDTFGALPDMPAVSPLPGLEYDGNSDNSADESPACAASTDGDVGVGGGADGGANTSSAEGATDPALFVPPQQHNAVDTPNVPSSQQIGARKRYNDGTIVDGTIVGTLETTSWREGQDSSCEARTSREVQDNDLVLIARGDWLCRCLGCGCTILYSRGLPLVPHVCGRKTARGYPFECMRCHFRTNTYVAAVLHARNHNHGSEGASACPPTREVAGGDTITARDGNCDASDTASSRMATRTDECARETRDSTVPAMPAIVGDTADHDGVGGNKDQDDRERGGASVIVIDSDADEGSDDVGRTTKDNGASTDDFWQSSMGHTVAAGCYGNGEFSSIGMTTGSASTLGCMLPQCDSFMSTRAYQDCMKIIASRRNGEPYICSYCGCNKRSLRELVVHICAQHTYEKPLKCNFCDFRSCFTHVMTVHKKRGCSQAKVNHGVGQESCVARAATADSSEGATESPSNRYAQSGISNPHASAVGVVSPGIPNQEAGRNVDATVNRPARPAPVNIWYKVSALSKVSELPKGRIARLGAYKSTRAYKDFLEGSLMCANGDVTCSSCHYKAQTLRMMLEHICRIHTGEKPFECPMCHYCTEIASLAFSHMRECDSSKKGIMGGGISVSRATDDVTTAGGPSATPTTPPSLVTRRPLGISRNESFVAQSTPRVAPCASAQTRTPYVNAPARPLQPCSVDINGQSMACRQLPGNAHVGYTSLARDSMDPVTAPSDYVMPSTTQSVSRASEDFARHTSPLRDRQDHVSVPLQMPRMNQRSDDGEESGLLNPAFVLDANETGVNGGGHSLREVSEEEQPSTHAGTTYTPGNFATTEHTPWSYDDGGELDILNPAFVIDTDKAGVNGSGRSFDGGAVTPK